MISALLLLVVSTCVLAATRNERLYEMRVYYAPARKGPMRCSRASATTPASSSRSTARQRRANWVPIDNKENKLVYIVAHKDLESRRRPNAFQAASRFQVLVGDDVDELVLLVVDRDPVADVGDAVLLEELAGVVAEAREQRIDPSGGGVVDTHLVKPLVLVAARTQVETTSSSNAEIISLIGKPPVESRLRLSVFRR